MPPKRVPAAAATTTTTTTKVTPPAPVQEEKLAQQKKKKESDSSSEDGSGPPKKKYRPAGSPTHPQVPLPSTSPDPQVVATPTPAVVTTPPATTSAATPAVTPASTPTAPTPTPPTPSADQTTPATSAPAVSATTVASTCTATSAADPPSKPGELPLCPYGANCYRKNPSHFQEYRHPTVACEDIISEHEKMKAEMRRKREEASKPHPKPVTKPAPVIVPPPSLLSSMNFQLQPQIQHPLYQPPPLLPMPKLTPLPLPPIPYTPMNVSPIPIPHPLSLLVPPPLPLQVPPPLTHSVPTSAAAPSPSKIKRTTSGAGDLVKDAAPSDEVLHKIESYKLLLKGILCKTKVSADEKRVLRSYRKNAGLDDKYHNMLLGQFGWTEDEYEDGERKAEDDIDIEAERQFYENKANAGRCEIFWLRKGALRSKDEENTFSRVCTKFYQTMSKAQGNYNVVKIGLIANFTLKEAYEMKRAEMRAKSQGDEEWGFHGTSEKAIDGISKLGFLHPDKIAQINNSKAPKGKKKKGAKAPPAISVLDDGFFGKGIYFSVYSDYALWYSAERDSSQILLCKLLTGRSYKCDGRMDGAGCRSGYDSHFSPKGNEIIMFAPESCLPKYIIEFEEQKAKDRDQED
ncbi:guanylate-binding protein [Pelomyxa schiedti]|nr:guanylate-binding protein [Pelomyxa schiedti]